MLNSGIFGGYCGRIRPVLPDYRLSKNLFRGSLGPGRGGGRGPPNGQKMTVTKITTCYELFEVLNKCFAVARL